MKKFVLVLLLCLAPSLASAQIANDVASISGVTGSTCTLSHTVSAGSNRIIFGGVINATGDHIDTATYDGVAMTLIGKLNTDTTVWSYLWYLVAPNSGTHNIVFSDSGLNPLTTICAAASYTGADQTLPIEVSTTNTASGSPVTSITTSVTTTTANDWTVLWSRNNAGAQANSTGSTQLVEDDSANVALYDSGGPVSAGSNSMAVTFSSSPTLAGTIMAAFCPSTVGCGGGAAPSVPRLLLLGVGGPQ